LRFGNAEWRECLDDSHLSLPKIPSGLDSHCKAESSHP
jgi:hypothetical protein